MNSEDQEKEIVIGTDHFEEPMQDNSATEYNEYWYELDIVPGKITPKGYRYTDFHLKLIHKWLDDVIFGNLIDYAYVPLSNPGEIPTDHIDLTRLAGRITGYEISEGKTWIRVVPVGPEAKFLNTFNELLKLRTLMIGSVEKIDDANTVGEDAQMLYFFLDSNIPPSNN